MRPIVQISLDLTSVEEALDTARMAMRSGVDWLEVGTPLIIADGMHGVMALRDEFPDTPIVADLGAGHWAAGFGSARCGSDHWRHLATGAVE